MKSTSEEKNIRCLLIIVMLIINIWQLKLLINSSCTYLESSNIIQILRAYIMAQLSSNKSELHWELPLSLAEYIRGDTLLHTFLVSV